MANIRPRRIHIQKYGEGAYEEGRAGGTILPGELITLGANGLYANNITADGPVETIFAIENALAGNPGSGGFGIDDQYVSGDLVRMVIPQRGDHILGLLAPGSNVKTGDHLDSNGSGMLKVANTDSDFVAVALEDRDASSSAATLTDRRIRVRIK